MNSDLQGWRRLKVEGGDGQQDEKETNMYVLNDSYRAMSLSIFAVLIYVISIHLIRRNFY